MPNSTGFGLSKRMVDKAHIPLPLNNKGDTKLIMFMLCTVCIVWSVCVAHTLTWTTTKERMRIWEIKWLWRSPQLLGSAVWNRKSVKHSGTMVQKSQNGWSPFHSRTAIDAISGCYFSGADLLFDAWLSVGTMNYKSGTVSSEPLFHRRVQFLLLTIWSVHINRRLL